MYAISFDLDTEQLKQQYPNDSWQNAYDDIRKELMPLGFTWQQGSVYFGDENMNAVKCVLAAQVLSKAYPWFKKQCAGYSHAAYRRYQRPQPCFINQGFKASLCATIQSLQPVFPLPAPPVRSLMPFFLQLLELPQAQSALKGVVMELEDGAFELLRDIVVTDDPKTAFKDADAAFLVGSRPRSKGMERGDLLHANAGIFKEQGRALNEAARR